jgi:hypothetical protein
LDTNCAFHAAIDVGIHDSVIRDEDWVYHIRNNKGSNDCKFRAMNTGLSTKCQWMGKQYLLPENVIRVMVMNQNWIVAAKTTRQKKKIQFYYPMLSPNKAIPDIPSCPKFWLGIWDDSERSN